MQRPPWLNLTPPLVFGLLVLGVAVLGCGVLYLPQMQTASLKQSVDNYRAAPPKPDLQELATLEKGRIGSENAIRTGLIQGLGGAAVLVGIYFTYRNLRTAEANLKATQRNVLIAEEKQVTERFSKAVEMLSSSNIHTRLGGMHALERSANDSDKDYWQVMEVLTAFVRSESPCPTRTKNYDLREELSQKIEWWQWQEFLDRLTPLRTDIQAVMTVIGRRKHRYGKGEWEKKRLNLQKTNLRKLDVSGADNLTGVDLTEAHLERADLTGAHLERADLTGAHLERADLTGAHLERADLTGAHLERADLTGAHLERADLTGAHLERADLEKADLEKAVMRGTHLENAYLSAVNLTRTDLSGTDLSQVGSLNITALKKAIMDDLTKLPSGLRGSDLNLPLKTPLPPTILTSPFTVNTEPSSGSSPESIAESSRESKSTET